jgi:hypothetical protein
LDERKARIVITEEELDEVDQTNDRRLVITGDDLPTRRQPTVITHEDLAAIEEHTAVGGLAPESRPAATSVGRKTASTPLGITALLGALGGLLADGLCELALPGMDGPTLPLASTLLQTSIYAAALGAFISTGLAIADDLAAGVWSKVLRRFWRAFLAGAVLGGLGGLAAQAVYSALSGGLLSSMPLQIAVRALVWGIVGVGIGLAQSLGSRPGRRRFHGAVGGGIGGMVGGGLFDILSLVTQTGIVSRMAGTALIGLAIGLAVVTVHEMVKEAWLSVESGPRVGKRYVLCLPETRIGTSPDTDFTLPPGELVEPLHCVLVRGPNGFTLLSKCSAASFVNGRPADNRLLRRGDTLQIGRILLRYDHRSPRG